MLPSAHRATPTRDYPAAVRLSPGSAAYPAGLARFLGTDAPATIAARGNLDLLRGRTLAFLCSVKCPGALILHTLDRARALRDAGVTVVGGFQSPLERECLDLLLRGPGPTVICPARSIADFRLPAAWRRPLAAGRLLLLSPFPDHQRRPTAALARARNRFVAALADDVLIAHASPGGATEALALDLLRRGRPLHTLDDPANAALLRHGARPLSPGAPSPWHTPPCATGSPE